MFPTACTSLTQFGSYVNLQSEGGRMAEELGEGIKLFMRTDEKFRHRMLKIVSSLVVREGMLDVQ